MPRVATPNGSNKFQRYRVNKHRQGMKLLRVWVPDPTAPGFTAEAQQQAALLRGALEERAALDFIEAAADFEDWTP